MEIIQKEEKKKKYKKYIIIKKNRPKMNKFRKPARVELLSLLTKYNS